MESLYRMFLLVVSAFCLLVSASGCGGTDGGDGGVDDDVVDDDVVDDDAADDGGYSVDFTRPPSNEARAAAFKLFYRERTNRILTSYNRFGMVGDLGWATTISKHAIARSGDEFEVVTGPNDNNTIGYSVFTTYQMYKALGGRELELTLIRMFEGLAFLEAVTGHPGLTVREALPGWTMVVDGANDEVVRYRNGEVVEPPWTYPDELEQEILDTFYDGIAITYREDPSEYYFNFKAINELEAFAITFVFAELPNFLRISDCCSSWMITKKGEWIGAFWGNHNSRDNLPDLAIGYLTAMDCAQDPDVPDDLRQAARRAAEAGLRVGDTIVAYGNKLMTVGEFGSYDDLIVSGERRPDGTYEWQDLGSMAGCQRAYLAQALSSDGLHYPVPRIPLPGSYVTEALQELFKLLGIELPAPTGYCEKIDEALAGITWEDVLEFEILGQPWYEVAHLLAQLYPELFPELLGSMVDDFNESELAVAALCYYAQIAGEDQIFYLAKQTLEHFVTLHRILVDLVYAASGGGGLPAGYGWHDEGSFADWSKNAEENLYTAAIYARMFGLDAPDEDFGGFALGESRNQWIESQLTRGDTSPWPLMSDAEIESRILQRLAQKEPWIQDRYWARFSDGPPVRRAGDGYEAVGPDGNWMPTENPRHEWFGGFKLWFEVPLCVFDPWTLDCKWAAIGCARVDLDGSGVVDESDRVLFEAAWQDHGEGASCSDDNDWCSGADLDHSGVLDEDDQAFMDAAMGCYI